jgi:hypothetical protein
VKKIVLLMVLLGVVFCLYAQDLGDGVDVYDFDALYEEPADPPQIPPVTSEEEKPRGFFETVLGYFDDPDVKTRHLDRKRIFELRLIDAGAQFGNNLVSLNDIFKKVIDINLDKFNDRINDNLGVGLNMGFDLNAMRVSVNPTERWGGSFGFNTSGRFDVTIPKELLDLIVEGNERNKVNTGEFVVSGSLFYEIGFNVHGTLPVLDNKLTVGITPAFYSPLLYIPASSVKYTVDTDNKLLVDARGSFKAYTALNTSEMDAGAFFKNGGVDISLSAEYALFKRLDLGLTLSRIPLLGASMDSGYELSFAPEGEAIMKITDLTNFETTPNIPELTGGGDFTSLPQKTVFRPFRFDFYTIYRPLNDDLLSIRPNIGFTAPAATGGPYLNMGIRAALDLSRIFVLYLDSGLEENLWRHKLGFELNLRAFELDIEAALRSQDYLLSWQGSGASVKLGIALGW